MQSTRPKILEPHVAPIANLADVSTKHLATETLLECKARIQQLQEYISSLLTSFAAQRVMHSIRKFPANPNPNLHVHTRVRNPLLVETQYM